MITPPAFMAYLHPAAHRVHASLPVPPQEAAQKALPTDRGYSISPSVTKPNIEPPAAKPKLDPLDFQFMNKTGELCIKAPGCVRGAHRPHLLPHRFPPALSKCHTAALQVHQWAVLHDRQV